MGVGVGVAHGGVEGHGAGDVGGKAAQHRFHVGMVDGGAAVVGELAYYQAGKTPENPGHAQLAEDALDLVDGFGDILDKQYRPGEEWVVRRVYQGRDNGQVPAAHDASGRAGAVIRVRRPFNGIFAGLGGIASGQKPQKSLVYSIVGAEGKLFCHGAVHRHQAVALPQGMQGRHVAEAHKPSGAAPEPRFGIERVKQVGTPITAAAAEDCPCVGEHGPAQV